LARPLDKRYPLGLAVLAFGLALCQRPGLATADTKVDLHVDPGGFLAAVASTWTPTVSLGHVWGGQYGGYLFPMGPFFALGDWLGLGDWLVHRLWLGALLALAAWGTVRLLDALWSPRRGLAHAVAGAAMVLNPYVVVFANRTSVTLLAYAALPWLLLAVHRGVRDPGGWRWPAAFALLIAATGGGVNAAVTAWVLVGPALLAAYEPAVGGARWRDTGAFALRAAGLTAAVSLWWIVPVLTQATYGIDFLSYIEQAGTIWSTTSATEALRLMGYWTSYTGVSFSGPRLPLYDDSGTLLFSTPVVLASLLLPALAVAGFVWTRRWRYGPFFLGLALVGVAIVMAGFPEDAPLRDGLHFVYNRVEAVQFLRTSYKAAPLIAVAWAVLLGTGAAELVRRLAGRGGRAAPAALAAGLAAVLVVAAWPLARGRGVELTNRGVPAAWTSTAGDLDRELPAGRRAVVLPGSLFSFYRWGGTVDPILPVLSERPVAIRQIVPYADLHSVDLQWWIDLLVQQRRLYPGQLRPLLDLAGTGAVVSATDDDRARSGGPPPGNAAAELAGQGLDAPARAYGPRRRFAAPLEAGPDSYSLPQVRRYDLPGSRGLVRLAPRGPATIVDGSAEGLTALAAFGALPERAPVRYAGDLSRGELRAEAARGARIVVTDSNRRRVYVNPLLAQNVGWTLGPSDPVSADAAFLNPFAGRGSQAQTVALLRGARYLRSPLSPGFPQFPEHRPFAAFDGDLATAWLADRDLVPRSRWLEVGFERPRPVPYVDLLPYVDSRGAVEEVEIGGRRFGVRPGWNRLRLGERRARSLRIRMARVRIPPGVTDGGGGGIRELRVPGLRVSEALRPPRLAERSLAGADLRRVELAYLFARTTGDEPLRRAKFRGPAQARAVRDRADGETSMRRVFAPPAARAWQADAWVVPSPDAPDDLLDRLAGYDGRVRARSSSRYANVAGFRASSAFDSDAATAWIGQFRSGRPAWLEWRGPRAVVVRELRIEPPERRVATPAVVRVRTEATATPPLRVGRDGTVVLGRPVRARAVRLEVLAVRAPARATPGERAREAVGVGELRGPWGPAAVPRAGTLRGGCGDVTFRVGATTVPMRVEGRVAALDAGTPLRARACGGPRTLPAGPQRLQIAPGPLRVDHLRLLSAAPDGLPAPRGGGRVLDPGEDGHGSRDGVRVAATGPSWLVLGESYNRGWRAWCDERELGRPEVVDGFANGWKVNASCRDVRFAFAPDRVAVWAYVASGLAGIVLLLVLVLGARRVRMGPAAAPSAAGDLVLGDHPAPWPLPRAALLGLLAGAGLGFVFAWRAGVLIAPAVTLVLWRGIGARALVLAAAALLGLVVPALYLLFEPRNRGGYNFDYAVDLIGAHWVGVAALVLLLLALGRTAAAQRETISRATPPSPAHVPGEEPAPPVRA
jgi:arabinofuranan 3-O-arabinosyltransferase